MMNDTRGSQPYPLRRAGRPDEMGKCFLALCEKSVVAMESLEAGMKLTIEAVSFKVETKQEGLDLLRAGVDDA